MGIEKIIFKICPACKKESYLRYIGEQKGGIEILELYTCYNCGSTRSLHLIEEFNKEKWFRKI